MGESRGASREIKAEGRDCMRRGETAAAGTEMQEERLVDTNDGGKGKDEGIMF